MDQTVSPHPHTDLIAGLRELADLMESRPDLAVGRYSTGVSVGALRSREQLEAWATVLGAEIAMGGPDGDIPVVRHRISGFRFDAQGPREPGRSRLAEAEAEIARLRAELAARTEPDDEPVKPAYPTSTYSPSVIRAIGAHLAEQRTESDR